MPVPRISGVFNNCLPHTLIPELHEKIRKLKKPDRRRLNPLQLAYNRLKTSFAAFYNIADDTFAWDDFIDLLDTYNEFDLQILLGPVLRQFMADTMRLETDLVRIYKAAEPQYAEDETNDAFITYKTIIQENGRYTSISPDEVFSFLFAPLGFKLTYHQDNQVRTLPENDEFISFGAIEIFHQGGIDGAQAGGHWERTNDEKERTEDELSEHTHFHRLAALLRNDDSQLTRFYVQLLQDHVSRTLNELRQPSGDDDVFHNFELTLAQIEKFLYNRMYVDKNLAKQLLGELTQAAEEAIAELPNLEGTEYNELINAHFPLSPTYNQPLKSTYSTQQYKIALSLLAPPVPKLPANPYARGEAWSLRAHEISVLSSVTESYIEHILFEEGLSQSLYDACDHEEIADELSDEFFRLLVADPNFSTRASRLLLNKALGLELIDIQFESSSELNLDDFSSEHVENSGSQRVVVTLKPTNVDVHSANAGEEPWLRVDHSHKAHELIGGPVATNTSQTTPKNGVANTLIGGPVATNTSQTTAKNGVANTLLRRKSSTAMVEPAIETETPPHPLVLTQGKGNQLRRLSSQKIAFEAPQDTGDWGSQKPAVESSTAPVTQLSSYGTPMKGSVNPLRAARQTSSRKSVEPYYDSLDYNSPESGYGRINPYDSDNDGEVGPRGEGLLGALTDSLSGLQLSALRQGKSMKEVSDLAEGVTTVHTAQTQPPITADFWLRAAQVFLCVGGTLAVIAVLTSPPVAASLGITQILGVAVTDVLATVTFGAIASTLTSLCMFAMRSPAADSPKETGAGLRPTY